jgi:hypothetical protein
LFISRTISSDDIWSRSRAAELTCSLGRRRRSEAGLPVWVKSCAFQEYGKDILVPRCDPCGCDAIAVYRKRYASLDKASTIASCTLGRTCLIAWFAPSGQVRLVKKVIESSAEGSIQSDVPV